MTEEEQHQSAVIGRMFALLTARCEDGAQLAVRGQAAGAPDRTELALRLLDVGQEITTIAEGLSILLASD